MIDVKQSLLVYDKNKLILLIFTLTLLIAGAFIFDTYVLWMAWIALLVSGIVDLLFAQIRKYPLTLNVFISPLIFVLLLPPNLPLFMVGVGAFFSAFFVKAVFGGDDKYIFNPAAAGVLFLMITFPAQMNTMWLDPVSSTLTTTLPVSTLTASVYSFSELAIGLVPGTVGTTFRLGIVIIGLIMILFKLINWKITVSYLASFGIFTLIFHLIQGVDAPLWMSYMTGSVLFASVFLATDDPTIPKKPQAIWFYGLGLGLLTALIRGFAAFPEGVIFAVIIMNAIAPLIDSFYDKEATNE
jgi:Na+-transporting NADH:ubiquinone oxidoreductase subunit B/electron transport complex protein RnfD